MAALVHFTITPDGGEPVKLVASKLDAIRVERELNAPLVARAQEGYFEPVLRLAYAAASRSALLPPGTTFDEFVDGWEIALETDDEDDDPKEEPAP